MLTQSMLFYLFVVVSFSLIHFNDKQYSIYFYTQFQNLNRKKKKSNKNRPIQLELHVNECEILNIMKKKTLYTIHASIRIDQKDTAF